MTYDAIKDAIRQLTPAEQDDLRHRLDELRAGRAPSADDAIAEQGLPEGWTAEEAELTPAQRSDLMRRFEELDRDPSMARPWAEVRADLHAKMGWARE